MDEFFYRADWAAWHLPCGPVGPPSRWATTSNVEVGQTIYPVNRRRVGREGKEGSVKKIIMIIIIIIVIIIIK